MSIASRPWLLAAALAGAGALLAGCEGSSPSLEQSSLRLSDDFGRAVREDVAAQIVDPDPSWKAGPPPPSDGERAALAQKRYQHDVVIQPSTAATSQAVSSGGGGGSPGGAPPTGGP